MMGEKSNGVPGLVDLCVDQLFSAIDAQSEKDYMVRVSYIEIYNESVRDLLNPTARPLRVRHSVDTGFFVESQEVVVTEPAQVDALRESGDEVRSVGVTNMNQHSSRSHTIFRVIVEGTAKAGGQSSVAHLNLVDLAGSERVADTGAEGQRLKEAININKSLSTLSQIVRMLSEQAKGGGKRGHLPFRDSKLTQILQPALGGNSKTAFICTVCCAEQFLEECKRTLTFAESAKSVENKVMVNTVVDERALIREYKAEIEKLKAKVATLKAGGGGDPASGAKLKEAEAALSSEKSARERAEQQQEELQAKIAFMESMVIGGGAKAGSEAAADAAISPRFTPFAQHQGTEAFVLKVAALESRQAQFEERLMGQLQQEREDHAKALRTPSKTPSWPSDTHHFSRSGSDGVVQIDACAESLQEQLVAAGNSSAKGVAEEIAKSRVATERARERCVPTPNPLLLSTVSSPVIVCV